MNDMDRAGAECISIGSLFDAIEKTLKECTENYIYDTCVTTIKGE